MQLELTNTEVAVILEALGKEKEYLNAHGYRESAHKVSDIQSKIKNGE